MRIEPGVVAEIVDHLTPRLRKRVDALVAQHEISPEGQTRIGNATVSLADVETITSADQISCDCLLSPDCAHRAAVALSLEVTTTASVQPVASAGTETLHQDDGVLVKLSEAQVQAIASCQEHLAALLQVGCTRMPAMLKSALLSDLHLMRVAGLVTAERALTSLITTLSTDPDARLAAMAAAMSNLHDLTSDAAENGVDMELIGRVRAPYRDVGGLNLTPLAAGPVLTASGFSGVEVSFVDAAARIWTLSRITPGGAAGVREHYLAGEPWGGASDSLKDLSRHQVLVSNATASPQGRLGGGKQVRVAIGSPCRDWSTLPAGYQVITGEIESGTRVVLVVDGRQMQLTQTAQRLGAGLGLELFGQVRGARVRCLARASGPAPELLGLISLGKQISLPDDLGGIWWPGLDPVTRDWVGNLDAPQAAPSDADPAAWTSSPPQVTVVLSRWLRRVLDGGSAVLTGKAIAPDASWLRQAGAPFAAELLENLVNATLSGTRDFDGTWQADPRALAQAWLALSRY